MSCFSPAHVPLTLEKLCVSALDALQQGKHAEGVGDVTGLQSFING